MALYLTLILSFSDQVHDMFHNQIDHSLCSFVKIFNFLSMLNKINGPLVLDSQHIHTIIKYKIKFQIIPSMTVLQQPVQLPKQPV